MFHSKQNGRRESRLTDGPTRHLQHLVLGFRLPRGIIFQITKLTRTEKQMKQTVVLRRVHIIRLHASHVSLVLLQSGLRFSRRHDTATGLPYLHHPEQCRPSPLQSPPRSTQSDSIPLQHVCQEQCHAKGFGSLRLASRSSFGADHLGGQITSSCQHASRIVSLELCVECHQLAFDDQHSSLEVLLSRSYTAEHIAAKEKPQDHSTIPVHHAEIKCMEQVDRK
jgi:hypothetical protein